MVKEIRNGEVENTSFLLFIMCKKFKLKASDKDSAY